MSNQNLFFKSVSVDNARGVRRGRGICCDELAQVNIIYGSNGIGKSTVGLALMALLAPAVGKLGENCDVAGVIELDDQLYNLIVRGQDGTAFSSAKAIPYPRFTSADQLTRYRLALEELIQSDDVEFAAIIAKETRGGFDLEEIVSRRKYKLRPATPQAKQTRLEKQRTQCAELRRKQEALASWESTLVELNQQKLSLLSARNEFPAIQAVRRIHDHQLALDSTLNLLSSFPDVLELLSGTDSEFITKKEESREAVNAEVAELQKSIVDLNNNIESGGQQEIVEQLEIDRIKIKNDSHRGLVAKRLDLMASIAGQTAEADGCLEVFTQTVSDDVAEQFDGLGWLQIESLWAQEIQCRDHRNAAQRLVEVFDEDCETSQLQESLVGLRQDVDVLHQWLRTPDVDDLVSGKFENVILITSMLSMAAFTVILANAAHVGWLGLLCIPLCLAFLFLKGRVSTNIGNQRKVIEQHCESRIVIDVWDQKNVAVVVEAKYKEQGELASRIVKSQNSDAAKLQLIGATRQHQESIAAIQKWATSLKLTWDVIGPFHFIDVFRSINRRNNLLGTLQGLHGELAQIDTDIAMSLEAMTSVFKAWGHPVSDASDNLLPDITNLEQIMQRRSNYLNKLVHLGAQIETKQGISQELANDINRVYNRLGVEDGAVDHIIELEKSLDSYSTLVSKRTRLETLISGEQNIVKSVSGALDWSEAELQEKEEYATHAEGKLNELQDMISGNKGKISVAGASSELSEALAKAESIQQDLIDDRAASFDEIVGQTLVDWLAEESTSDRTSDVFVEASSMLDKITQGQLKLGVSQSGKEEFFVTAPGNDRRELDQLSVGERVQVLLSIRMAFLGHSELAVLPLVLDETLGTSDDERAHDIIKSVLELASLGRQVFYFTAQTDEVAKWKLLLEQYPSLKSRFIDLDSQLDHTIGKEIPKADAFSLAVTVAAPVDCSHQEFGEQLGVRRPILFPYNSGGLHLWYLIEDLDLLFACSQMRVITWGSLQRLAQNTGSIPFINKEQFGKLQSRAAAVTNAVHQWSVGRAAPITRQDLQESGGVSNTYLERIWEVAVRAEYCGAALINELRGESRPKQWSDSKTEKLEEYLCTIGKIDTATRSTPDEIYSQAALTLEAQGERLSDNEVWLTWILQNILHT
jgi:energy-coupling factor transporter ATP-binding protein EcfA2